MSIVFYNNPRKSISKENPELYRRKFKSLLFIVCLKRKYAKAFIEKGTIRFAKPSEWRPDNTSRGDLFEGTYASTTDENRQISALLSGIRDNTSSYYYDGIKFFKSADSCSLRAYCMYSLNDSALTIQKKRSQDHKYHEAGSISKLYFHLLFPEWDKKKYLNVEDDEKPMVLILKPDAFMKRVIDSLHKIGVMDEEILCQPVQYFDYNNDAFIINPFPFELFFKDSHFKNQHEVRIVINTKRKKIIGYLEKQDGIIELGKMDETVATLSDYYFDNVVVEKRGNKLLYSLANPKKGSDSPMFIMGYIQQVLSDELPEGPLSVEEIKEKIKECSPRLEHYKIKYDENTHYCYYDGKIYDLAGKAAFKQLRHYVEYMNSGELEKAKETREKYKCLFPMFDDLDVDQFYKVNKDTFYDE